MLCCGLLQSRRCSVLCCAVPAGCSLASIVKGYRGSSSSSSNSSYQIAFAGYTDAAAAQAALEGCVTEVLTR
jgi:hypothetical protein